MKELRNPTHAVKESFGQAENFSMWTNGLAPSRNSGQVNGLLKFESCRFPLFNSNIHGALIRNGF